MVDNDWPPEWVRILVDALNKTKVIKIEGKENKFDTERVRLITDKNKDLELTNWHVGEFFAADVLCEDGIEVTKKRFFVTAKSLVGLLKPISEKAEGKTIDVRILKTGKGYETHYDVVQKIGVNGNFTKTENGQ